MVQQIKDVGQIIKIINNLGIIADGNLETLQGIIDIDDDDNQSYKILPVINQRRSNKKEN